MDIYWKPVNRIVWISGFLGAILFFVHALIDDDGFLILDYINLPFHEAGHIFFSPFGRIIEISGGTITQFAIPLLVLTYFFIRGESTGVAFSWFWFGENFLYTSLYMADARSMRLPLVGGGEHDWNIIFNELGILEYDTLIASVTKFTGWFIMILSVIWFTFMAFKKDKGM